MNLNEFMEKNNIVIVAKANLQEKSFEIIKNDLELESYDLFEQLVLFGSIDNLMESITKRRLNETKPQEMPMTGRFGRGRFGDRGRFCVSLKQGDTEPSPVSRSLSPNLPGLRTSPVSVPSWAKNAVPASMAQYGGAVSLIEIIFS